MSETHRLKKHLLPLASTLIFASVSVAAPNPIPGTWTSVSSTIAVGSVGGVEVTATTNADAPFTTVATHRFADDDPCGGWDADGFALPALTDALTTTWVNGGDYQQFDFDVPWADGYFYIENFDSSSMATVTLTGGEIVGLAARSSSISYDATSGSTGKLSSSNSSFNGEGDLVLQLSGPVSSIRVDFNQGVGANGIFYAFADSSVVPEPASLLVWGGFALLGLVVKLRFS